MFWKNGLDAVSISFLSAAVIPLCWMMNSDEKWIFLKNYFSTLKLNIGKKQVDKICALFVKLAQKLQWLVKDKAYQSCIFRKPVSRNILPPPAQGFDWPNKVRPRWRWHSSPPPPPCSALAKQRCQSVVEHGKLAIIEVEGEKWTHQQKITTNNNKLKHKKTTTTKIISGPSRHSPPHPPVAVLWNNANGPMVVYNFVEQCFRPEMIKAGMLQARRIVDKNKVQTIFRHLTSVCRNEAWFSHREYWRTNRKQYPGLKCDLVLWEKLWFQTIKHGPIFKRALLSSKQDRLLRGEGEGERDNNVFLWIDLCRSCTIQVNPAI